MAKSKHYINGKGEEYEFEVKVFTRPNLRGSMDEMFMYRGKRYLEMMFDAGVIDPTVTSIDFQYPERWANILEQRAMVDRIPVAFPNIKDVEIVTHSVYIIQCTQASHIRIYDDPSKYEEKSYTDLSVRYCDPPNQMTGLMVITPDSVVKLT